MFHSLILQETGAPLVTIVWRGVSPQSLAPQDTSSLASVPRTFRTVFRVPRAHTVTAAD